MLVLVDHARPERLGPLVRAVLTLEPELEVHTSALRLPAVRKGTALVLVPDLAQAEWMNLERPLFMHQAL
ncbi:MAG TPA: hypothetical protein VLS89_06630, partial [Candidatus Nanopelagicales bacterium]|nr:hypothetical protein [Candidatus Nanopelagicales bacterium]